MIKYHKESDPRLGDDPEDEGDVDGVWRTKTPNPNDFEEARNGDHLICPFLCDLCIFHLVRRATPNPQSHKDLVLLSHIRRINLDAFWSRSTSTIRGNARVVKRTLDDARGHGMNGP